jgi:hypothetical protein
MVYRYPAPRLLEEVQYEGGYFVPPGSGLEVCEIAYIYCPRNPEESILYGAAYKEAGLEARILNADLFRWERAPQGRKIVHQTLRSL